VFIFVVHKSNAKAAQSRLRKVLHFSRQQKAVLLVLGFVCQFSQTDRQTDKTVTEEAAFASSLGLRTIV
jgi:hypothetical protein